MRTDVVEPEDGDLGLVADRDGRPWCRRSRRCPPRSRGSRRSGSTGARPAGPRRRRRPRRRTTRRAALSVRVSKKTPSSAPSQDGALIGQRQLSLTPLSGPESAGRLQTNGRGGRQRRQADAGAALQLEGADDRGALPGRREDAGAALELDVEVGGGRDGRRRRGPCAGPRRGRARGTRSGRRPGSTRCRSSSPSPRSSRWRTTRACALAAPPVEPRRVSSWLAAGPRLTPQSAAGARVWAAPCCAVHGVERDRRGGAGPHAPARPR